MTPNALESARQYYRINGRNLSDDVNAILSNPHGVLVMTPQMVAILKPVRRREELLWSLLSDDPDEADGWYIHLLVGQLAQARQFAWLLPPLEWCCFHRGRRNRRPHCLPWCIITGQTLSSPDKTIERN